MGSELNGSMNQDIKPWRTKEIIFQLFKNKKTQKWSHYFGGYYSYNKTSDSKISKSTLLSLEKIIVNYDIII